MQQQHLLHGAADALMSLEPRSPTGRLGCSSGGGLGLWSPSALLKSPNAKRFCRVVTAVAAATTAPAAVAAPAAAETPRGARIPGVPSPLGTPVVLPLTCPACGCRLLACSSPDLRTECTACAFQQTLFTPGSAAHVHKRCHQVIANEARCLELLHNNAAERRNEPEKPRGGPAPRRGAGVGVDSGVCPECGTEDALYVVQGARTCLVCGIVTEVEVISDAAEWRSFADDGGDDPSRVGQPSSAVDGLLAAGGGGAVGGLRIGSGGDAGMRRAMQQTQARLTAACQDDLSCLRSAAEALGCTDVETQLAIELYGKVRGAARGGIRRRPETVAAVLLVSTTAVRSPVERLLLDTTAVTLAVHRDDLYKMLKDLSNLMILDRRFADALDHSDALAGLTKRIASVRTVEGAFPPPPKDAAAAQPGVDLRRPLTSLALEVHSVIRGAVSDDASLAPSLILFCWDLCFKTHADAHVRSRVSAALGIDALDSGAHKQRALAIMNAWVQAHVRKHAASLTAQPEAARVKSAKAALLALKKTIWDHSVEAQARRHLGGRARS